MKKGKNIVRYTTDQLKAKRPESGTDLSKIDALLDEQLELFIAEDEHDIQPDWTRAELILPHAKRSVYDLKLTPPLSSFSIHDILQDVQGFLSSRSPRTRT